MITIKDLVDELMRLGVDPDRVRISGKFYDDVVENAEKVSEKEEE